MFKTLESRLTVAIVSIVIVSLGITTTFFSHQVKQELSNVIQNNALNLLEATKNLVELQHNSILFHRDSMLSRRKEEIKNNVFIVHSIINDFFKKYQNGEISENIAKQNVINLLKELRYADDVGYFWVNDTTRPFPRMIMHPTIPELDGQVLDHPKFNCALGKQENLFKAFLDVCDQSGEGYVDYFWPKPMPSGLTEQQPKISYVKLFQPWNWIVGSGLYIDDLDKDVQKRVNAVIQDLNRIMRSHSLGENGYFYIFNEKNQMLVHPSLANQHIGDMVRPDTGSKLVDDLKKTARSPHKVLEYLWDKPGNEGEYKFPKKAYITYYEPLGWYIASSVYTSDYEHKINSLTYTILTFSVGFIIIAFCVSLVVSRSITNPLNRFIQVISKTNREGIPVKAIPQVGTVELQALSATMNKMIYSIVQSRRALQKSEEQFRTVVEQSNTAIEIYEPDGRLIIVNDAWAKFWNLKKDAVENFNIFDDPQCETTGLTPAFREAQLGKATFIPDVCYEPEESGLSGGRQRWISPRMYPLKDRDGIVQNIVLTYEDITSRKKAETELEVMNTNLKKIVEERTNQLLEAERFAALGSLSASVAHEINNPLQGMKLHVELLNDKFSKKLEESKSYYYVLQNMDKIKNIISQLLNAFKGRDIVKTGETSANINEIVEEVSALVKIQMKVKEINFSSSLDDRVPTIECNSTQIYQVVLNLLINATDSVEEKGAISVETELSDNKIFIKIKDDGGGIEEKNMSKLFEPFFSTKGVVGVGLGLFVSKSIAKSHNGDIFVESKVGEGSTFTVMLPVS